MSSNTRIYAITEKIDGGIVDGRTRLVRATSQSQGLRYVAESSFTVRVATQHDLIEHVSAGVKVEDASATPGAETFDNPPPADGSKS